MKIYNWIKRFKSSAGQAAGVAILAGGMMFAGQANADVLLSEDFESATQTGGGEAGLLGGTGGAWGGYATGQNYSASDHTSALGGVGGAFYGHLIGVPNPAAFTVDFSAGDVVNISAGTANINFDGWLASYTANSEYTVFTADFYDGTGGVGTPPNENNLLGTLTLADGSVGTDAFDWTRYTTSSSLSGFTTAQSVTINYSSMIAGALNGNDAYADNIVISVSAVPEPGTLSILGLAGLGFALVRRRR